MIDPKLLENAKPVQIGNGLPAEIRATANLRAQLAMRVFDARNALRLTQTQYASRIGVSQSEISKIENGDSSISLKKIIVYAEQFGMELCFKEKAGRVLLRQPKTVSVQATSGWRAAVSPQPSFEQERSYSMEFAEGRV